VIPPYWAAAGPGTPLENEVLLNLRVPDGSGARLALDSEGDLMSHNLARDGFRVLKAASGEAGLEAVAAIRDREKLNSYYLLYAVLGEFEARLNHGEAAARYFRQALELAEIKSEQIFLSNRLGDCEKQRFGRTAN